MIARIWHGRTPTSRGDEYVDYIRETGVPAYRATEGNRGVYLLRRLEDGVADLLLISLWDSYEAIDRFAGADRERAVYFPRDDEYLLEKEPTVTHHEVLVEENG